MLFDDKEPALLSKCAVVKGRTDYELDTDSADVISDSNAASNKNENFEKEKVVAYAEYLHTLSTSRSFLSSAEGEPKDQTILKIVSHRDEEPQRSFSSP